MLREIMKHIKMLIGMVEHLISLVGYLTFPPIPLLEEVYLSQKEAAHELKVSTRSIRRFVERGVLPQDEEDGPPCYKKSDVDRIKKRPLR